jgi:hypothetical protein
MSAATRATLAVATSITTEAGPVNVTPYRRNLTPLEGFVHFVRRVRPPNGLGWMDTWQIWICLYQDAAASEEWLDANLPDLLDALRPHLVVTSAFVAELQPIIGGPVVPGVVLEGALPG